MESVSNRIKAFYDFNKSALISEFSMKEFYNFLDKSKIYVNTEFINYTNMLKDINVSEKINAVIGFGENKGSSTSINFLPRNFTKIYQSIDRTNQITIYDCETEKFSKISFAPDKISGFAFLPFSRYLNLGGRLLITGGYEIKGKLSHNAWIFEDFYSLYKSRVGASTFTNNQTSGENKASKHNETNTRSILFNYFSFVYIH